MKTTLNKHIVEEVLVGFDYNRAIDRTLRGMDGRLIIQPEYQRNYVYSDGNSAQERDVVLSVLADVPLGLLHFSVRDDGLLEVLDGQQRLTSLGRFVAGKFSVTVDGDSVYFGSLSADMRRKVLGTELLVHHCEGTEDEIMNLFEKINIQGVVLTEQEKRNAVYHGPFVTEAKKHFSNPDSVVAQLTWAHYVKGKVNRQEVLERALEWVSDGNVDEYLAKHRHDEDIDEIRNHFDTVIGWIEGVFGQTRWKEMRGLPWGALYRRYSGNSYNRETVVARVGHLLADPAVDKSGRKHVFEYVLSGEDRAKARLLKVRLFSEDVKRKRYDAQTADAQHRGVSNCPSCVSEDGTRRDRVWLYAEMEADHVTPWSKNGTSTVDNCQMLCIAHNRVKGNA